MKRATLAILAVALTIPAMAQINANGFITDTGSGPYSYDIWLNNTGNTTIGTLWYSWVPGGDFMFSLPTNLAAPTGWSASVQGGGSGDGYSVQYVAQAGHELAGGQSLHGFKFTSADTPTDLNGNSVYFNHPAVGTSFVYQGQPFSGQQKEFIINVVPEPISALVLAPALLLLRRRRRTA